MSQRVRCDFCNDDAPVNGSFKVIAEKYAGKTICFACIYVHMVSGSNCQRCGKEKCGALVAVETEGGAIIPIALCPPCMTIQEFIPREINTSLETGRVPIPELAGTQ